MLPLSRWPGLRYPVLSIGRGCKRTDTATVEPPVNDQPKCKDWVIAYGRWSFTRIEPQRASSEKRSRHIYFTEDNWVHAMSNCSMLSLKFFVYFKWHNAHCENRDQRMRQVVAYKRLKTRLWLVFLIGGRLWEVVAYERWSHMEVRLYSKRVGDVDPNGVVCLSLGGGGGELFVDPYNLCDALLHPYQNWRT